jgi:hypothetical protein
MSGWTGIFDLLLKFSLNSKPAVFYVEWKQFWDCEFEEVIVLCFEEAEVSIKSNNFNLIWSFC